MLVTNAQAGKLAAGKQAAAFESLQAAITRLAVKRDLRAENARQELRQNVDRALEAYREYIKVVGK